MKASIYCLLSTFLFLFCGCWWLEEDDCTPLPTSITVRINAVISDATESTRCEYGYAVDFYKDHCGGGPSSTMSYLFKGCYEDTDGLYFVNREGIGSWDLTFKYEEDKLNVKLVEDTGKELIGRVLDGKTIYDRTNQGSKALTLLFILKTESVELHY